MLIFTGQLNPHTSLGEGLCQAQAAHHKRKACAIQKVCPGRLKQPWGRKGLTSSIGTQSTERPGTVRDNFIEGVTFKLVIGLEGRSAFGYSELGRKSLSHQKEQSDCSEM